MISWWYPKFLWWQQQLRVQSAAATAVAANSVPCLHLLLPTLKLGSNLSFYPTLQNASPVPTSQDCVPALCLCSRQPAGSSCLVVGVHLAAQVSFWTGQQQRTPPSELWSSTPGCTTVGNLHYPHIFSIKADYFLDMLMNSSAASFFLFQTGKGSLDCLCYAFKNKYSQQILTLECCKFSFIALENDSFCSWKASAFSSPQTKYWSISDGNKLRV